MAIPRVPSFQTEKGKDSLSRKEGAEPRKMADTVFSTISGDIKRISHLPSEADRRRCVEYPAPGDPALPWENSRPRRLKVFRIRLLTLCVLALTFLSTCSGCVERRLLIRSNPPGAMVYVDDYQIGVTPIGTSFTYYGTRKIRLVKDGYQTLTVYEKISPPWYQIPPFDFFAENILRREIRDTRVLNYQLVPQPVAPTQQLLDRAESLRMQASTQPPLPAAQTTIGTSPQNLQFDQNTRPYSPTEIAPSATRVVPGGRS